MSPYFHVTSRRNRESIEQHGLDWRRMRAASGIAGARRPEVGGVFLCRDEFEVEFFCRINAPGGELDVWAVHGVDEAELVESAEGYCYLPRPIALADLARVPTPDVEPAAPGTGTSAYGSTLTITFDDGRVVRDEAAHEWMREHS